MATSVIDGLPEDRRRFLLGLVARGVGLHSMRRLYAVEYPDEKSPSVSALQRWRELPETRAELSTAIERIRRQAPEKSFADARQQIDALTEMAETTWGLYKVEASKDKPAIATLCKLGYEFRETARAIREAAAPFQIQSTEVLAPFVQVLKSMESQIKGQPMAVQEAFGMGDN